METTQPPTCRVQREEKLNLCSSNKKQSKFPEWRARPSEPRAPLRVQKPFPNRRKSAGNQRSAQRSRRAPAHAFRVTAPHTVPQFTPEPLRGATRPPGETHLDHVVVDALRVPVDQVDLLGVDVLHRLPGQAVAVHVLVVGLVNVPLFSDERRMGKLL